METNLTNANPPAPAEKEIKEECFAIQELLLAKNASYGNAALEPFQCFSKASAEERMNVRIDDKLSRIFKGHEFGDEDTELDLIGYLILKRVERKIRICNQKTM